MRFEIQTKRVQINGRWHDFKVVPHPGAVVIAAEQEGRVALLRQDRPAVEERLWELPAGTLGEGEDPAQCAQRELAEETGLRARQVEKLGAFYAAPGYCTEILHLFRARELTAGDADLEDSEDIDQVAWFTLEEVEAMIRAGDIRDAKTIAGICYLRITS